MLPAHGIIIVEKLEIRVASLDRRSVLASIWVDCWFAAAVCVLSSRPSIVAHTHTRPAAVDVALHLLMITYAARCRDCISSSSSSSRDVIPDRRSSFGVRNSSTLLERPATALVCSFMCTFCRAVHVLGNADVSSPCRFGYLESDYANNSTAQGPHSRRFGYLFITSVVQNKPEIR